MIVGRDEDARMMLRTILEQWNYDVFEAADPDESIKAARDRLPSLVLLDSSLPFSDTLNDVAKLSESAEFEDIPSVMMSGYPQENYREAALNSGAAGYLVKPIDFDALRTYIHTLTGSQAENNERTNFRNL